MNPIALYFASGESLYPGAFLLLAAMLGTLLLKNKWLQRICNTTAWVGLLCILLACVPVPWIAYAALIVLFILQLIAWPSRTARYTIDAALAVLVVALVTMELLHRSLPQIPQTNSAHLVVIGDSISAGIDANAPWPKLLEQQSKIPVTNLSRPAIGTREATEIAKKLTPADTLILLEIGGNDMLFDLPSDEFEQQLEQLLKRIDNGQRTILMFELPLLPHKVAYGRIQRRLAAEHHVLLIPKRFFIDIISGGDATSDGLHLSPAGAQRMATLVEALLRPALPRSAN